MKFLRCMALAVLMLPALCLAQTYPSPIFNTVTLQTPLSVANGGTGGITSAAARAGISAAASGANGDITSLTGLTTPLSVAQGGTGATASTGSGSLVLATSPTLVTPALGTPSAAVLTNASGLPLTTGVTGTLGVTNGGTGTTTSTGTGATVRGTSPTITTPLTVGVTDGSSAAAGNVGEIISSTFTSVSMTNNTVTNLTSISLTAGDWDVSGGAGYFGSGAPVGTAAQAGSSTTSATIGAAGTYWLLSFAGSSSAATFSFSLPTNRISLTTTTTVFCVGSVIFSAGTWTASGVFRARRVR